MTVNGAIPCHFDGEQKGFSVGDKWQMTCATPEGVQWKETLRIEWPDQNGQYGLHILKIVSTSTEQTVLEVTGYRPSQYSNIGFRLTDGESTAEVQPMNWEIKSVLKQDEKEPYEPFGPFTISYPLWFWLLIGAAVISIASVITFILVRNARRRRLLDSMEQYNTMLTPFNQFSKDMRTVFKRLQSKHTKEEDQAIFRKIDEDFRLYLIRELRVPALMYTNQQILSDLKKYHRKLFKDLEPNIRKILTELEKARNDQARIETRDNEQLYLLSRSLGEQIYELKRKKS